MPCKVCKKDRKKCNRIDCPGRVSNAIHSVRVSDNDLPKPGKLKNTQDYSRPKLNYSGNKTPFLKRLWKKAKRVQLISFLDALSVYFPKLKIASTMLKTIKNWLSGRAKEKSTYQGLTVVLSAIGISVSPEQWEAFATLAAAIIGFIQVITKENKEPAE